MALNIKNAQVERLVEDITRITGESKTEAIRQALVERRNRLRFRVSSGNRIDRVRGFLEREVWPRVPADQVGHAPDRAERVRILGFGESGV